MRLARLLGDVGAAAMHGVQSRRAGAQTLDEMRRDMIGLVAREAEDLGAPQLRQLRRLVHADALSGPRFLPPNHGFGAAIDAVRRGVDLTAHDDLRRYLHAWRVHLDPPPSGAAMLDEVRTAVAGGLSPQDDRAWARFGGLVDAAGGGRAPHLALQGPTFIAGAGMELGRLTSSPATRRADPNVTERFAGAWAVAVDPRLADEAAVLDELRTLVAARGEPLDAAQLRRLRAVADHLAGDVRHPLRPLAVGTGTDPLGEIVDRIVTGAADPASLEPSMRRLRAHFVARRDDGAALRAEADTIVAHDVADITPEGWERLANLLDADPGRMWLTGPRAGAGSGSPSDLARTAARTGTVPASLARLHAAWQVRGGASTAAGSAMAAELVRVAARAPESLLPPDWVRLRALLDADFDGALPAPAGMDRSWMPTVIDEILRGARDPSQPDTFVWKWMTAWQREHDPTLAARAQAAAGAVADGPSTTAYGTWLRSQHVAAAGDGILARDHLRRAAQVLDVPYDVPGPSGMRATLQSVAHALSSGGAEAMPPPLEQAVRGIVERNIRLLDDVPLLGDRPGYAGHPDYGDLGTLRMHLRMVVARFDA